MLSLAACEGQEYNFSKARAHDSGPAIDQGLIAPSAPVFSALSPVSPSRTPNPRIIGSVSDTTVAIRFFLGAECDPSQEIGAGSPRFFKSSGVELDLPLNTSTQIYAKALNQKGIASECVLLSTFVHDSVQPRVTLEQISGQADPTNSLPIRFRVSFSKAIDPSSFAVNDIVQAGTATGVSWTLTNSGDNRNFDLVATSVRGEGTLIPTIAASAASDPLGNTSLVSTSRDNVVGYRISGPAAASNLRFSQSSPTKSTTLTAQWSVSNSSTLANQKVQFYSGSSCNSTEGGLIDLKSKTASQANLGASNGKTYTFKVTSLDALGNATVSGCSSPVSVDTVGPSVTITRTAGQGQVVTSLPVSFDVKFSERINASTFNPVDVLEIGTASGITWTISDTGDHMLFRLRATAIATAGTVIPKLNVGAAKDPADNSSALVDASGSPVEYVKPLDFQPMDGSGVAKINQDPAKTAANPSFAVVGGAKLYVAWQESGASGADQIHVALFNNNASAPAWNKVDGSSSGLNLDPALNASQPSLAATATKLFAAWAEFDATGIPQLHISAYSGDDAAPTWAPVEMGAAHDVAMNASMPSIVGLGAKLYVAWIEKNAAGVEQVHASVYNADDAAPAWTALETTGLNVDDQRVASAPQWSEINGQLYLGWNEKNAANVSLAHLKMYGGDDAAPVWTSLESGGLNADAAKSAESPQLARLGEKIFAIWTEGGLARTASYNGNTSWTMRDGNGMNRSASNVAVSPQLSVVSSRMYASWVESGRARVSLWHTGLNSWIPIDGGGISKSGAATVSNGGAVSFGSQLYLGLIEAGGLVTGVVR